MSATPKFGIATPPEKDPRKLYAEWAERYDRDPNPVLALVRRMLEPFLADVRDKVVVDIGCGTGQKLEFLVSRGAKAIGLDYTPEMLHVAAKKKSLRPHLVHADACLLPLQSSSADVVLCSFLMSFVSDLEGFAEQLADATVPKGDVFLVDLHPEAQRMGWRSALSPDGQVPSATTHELAKIRRVFDTAGFELETLLERRLGHPERRLFETVVRPDLFEQARHVPAAYLFHFRRRMLTRDRSRPAIVRTRPQVRHLLGARVAMGPHTAVKSDVVIEGGRIRAIYDRPSRARAERVEGDEVIDLGGMMLLPALINAHDHLRAGWPNWINRSNQLWLGAVRNLMNGVTTVLQHGMKEFVSAGPDFPLRFVRQYGWAKAHVQAGIGQVFRSAPTDVPFVIDCDCDDPEKMDEQLNLLADAGVLSDRTVLVGTPGISDTMRAMLEDTGTSVVWSPASELARTGRVSDIALLATSHRVSLGTGHQSTNGLGAEIKAALNAGTRPEVLYSMVTSRPYSMLRLRNGEGRLVAGTRADFVVMEDSDTTPAQTLCANAEVLPVALVAQAHPMLAMDGIVDRLSTSWKSELSKALFDGQAYSVNSRIATVLRNSKPQNKTSVTIGGRAISIPSYS